MTLDYIGKRAILMPDVPTIALAVHSSPIAILGIVMQTALYKPLSASVHWKWEWLKTLIYNVKLFSFIFSS